MDNATIVIANTRTMMGNRYVVEKDTKSLAGERILPLPALVGRTWCLATCWCTR